MELILTILAWIAEKIMLVASVVWQEAVNELAAISTMEAARLLM